MNDQALLNLVSSTFSSTLQSPLLPQHLQSLKKHLYNRSFADAFPTSNTKPEDQDACANQNALLETYVVRWVPTRALCYRRIIEQIRKYLSQSALRVVCIGAGCGSETLALQSAVTLNVDVVDSCPGWEPILSRITESANKVSLTSAKVNFHHGDIVLEYSSFMDLFASANLVTLMFTLNELITSQGKVPATNFLIELIKALPKGSLILIVDSPTYSVLEVSGRHFPASFLVDRLPGLEKIWEVESEWYRVDKELRYPIQLENMRFFGMVMRKK